MVSFVVAIMMCAGADCEIAQPEPDVWYPTYEACAAASEAKAQSLQAYLNQHTSAGRQGRIVCLRKDVSIVDVEELSEALETAVVRAEPSATSGYVGLVEKGERVLVNGRVPGTQWLRVVLKDGSTGFVFSDRLKTAGSAGAAGSQPAAPPAPPSVEAAPRPKEMPAQAAPAERRDCERCPVLVAVPAGTLTMGSGDDPTEKPVHKVAIPAFLLAKYEVSVAEWAACVDAGACSYKPPPPIDSDPARTPITNLSFADATEYVAWLRKETGKPYRLPSEAEWEYAARAGATTRYAWGDQVGTGHADCEGCGGAHDRRHPQPVDAFPPNRFGLSGMGGAVAEWVEDCWHSSYQGAPRDAFPWRTPNCMSHVLRGGAWTSGPKDITVSSRNYYDTSVRYPANGVRVAQDQTTFAR
ncbi:MAG: SUMF1/EgtB/PvdO family nonheme iron enzyme [Acetobacteraceae bacterium]|nr:SUMF1/EgtB/PvdO family nonheme iron enzyme [Acetobacteraceae bacterium]